MDLNLTDEQIAQLLDQATKLPEDKPAEQPNLKYRLGDQTFEAKTPEELQQQLDAAMAQIGQRVAQLQQAAAPKPADKPAEPTFDKETYARLFLDDPMKAQDYMDEIRYGVKAPAKVLSTVIKDVGAMEQAMAVQQFMGTAEGYTPTPENFATLSTYMQQYQLPWTANGMKLAFSQARADGRIAVPAEDDAPQQQTDSRFQMPTRRGVPTVSRGAVATSSIDADLIARYEDLPPEKMKAFLEQLQAR